MQEKLANEIVRGRMVRKGFRLEVAARSHCFNVSLIFVYIYCSIAWENTSFLHTPKSAQAGGQFQRPKLSDLHVEICMSTFACGVGIPS